MTTEYKATIFYNKFVKNDNINEDDDNEYLVSRIIMHELKHHRISDAKATKIMDYYQEHHSLTKKYKNTVLKLEMAVSPGPYFTKSIPETPQESVKRPMGDGISYNKNFEQIFNDTHKIDQFNDDLIDLHVLLSVAVEHNRVSNKIAIDIMNHYIENNNFLKPMYEELMYTLKNKNKVDEKEYKLMIKYQASWRALRKYRQIKDMKK